jgi:hypothetical protein
MKRLLSWLGGMAGGIALYRLFTRRAAPVAELPPPAPDPRAEELRAKLERQDESEPPAAEQPAAEPPESPDPVDESDPDVRRRRVHEEGRAAVHRMRGSR